MSSEPIDPALVHADELGSVSPRARPRLPADRPRRGRVADDAAGNRYLDAVERRVDGLVPRCRRRRHRFGRRAPAAARSVSSTTSSSRARRRSELARRADRARAEASSRVHFASGGAEANETAAPAGPRLPRRARRAGSAGSVISPAQAYHGPTMATLALTGRPGLQPPVRAVPAAAPPRAAADAALRPERRGGARGDRAGVETHGASTIAAFFCEAVRAAAMPAFTPPDAFWRGPGRAARAARIPGLPRRGRDRAWAAPGTGSTPTQLPFDAGHRATAKGLGAGMPPVGGRPLPGHVYDAVAAGSRSSSSATPGTARRCRARSAWP